MPKFHVDLEGERQFAGRLHAWERRKHAEIAALLVAVAGDVADDAERDAPERSGDLKKAIRAELERVLTDLVADVVAGVFYARFVENGTAKLAARPFLFPAFERHSRRYYDGLRRILSS